MTEVTVEQARKNLDHVPAKNETRLVGVVREDPKVRHRMLGEEGTKRKLSVIECQRFQVLERAQSQQVAPEVRPLRKGGDRGL